MPLRVGFLIQGTHCSRWQYDIVQRVEQEANITICFIGLNGEKAKQDSTPKPTEPNKHLFYKLARPVRMLLSLLNPRGYGIATLYNKFDEKHNGSGGRDSLWDSCAIGNYSKATTMTLQPIRKGYCHYFSPSDIEAIRQHELDVLVRFGFSIIRGEIHSCSTYGVWSFHHGDNRFYRGGPPGIWELIKGRPDIAVTLQLLSDVLDCGKTIARSSHRCSLYSVLSNKEVIYAACGDLLLQKLRQAQKQGFDSIKRTALFNEEVLETKILKSPRNLEILPMFWVFLKKYVGLRWPRKVKIQWYLATRKSGGKLGTFSEENLILPPNDRFYADPFLVSRNNQQYLFCEELIYRKGHAHLSVGRLENGKLIDMKPIIEEDFHLSYPFVFQDENEWYLIPESRTDKSVRLYRCVEFPYKWELAKKIMDNVELLDPTIYKQESTFFLFANKLNSQRTSSNELLCVFFSESIYGPWTPHPHNPVASDITNSRPAGNVFKHEGKLILPTQNCAPRYGYAVNFNEIDISKDHFSMKRVAGLAPDWKKGNLGSHTWNEDNGVIVTDGHRYIPA
ncbi:MAG: hypothetical protein GKR96_14725 [Gammaproteobacteria bacterium]|nr:hypothetical protein [Gammaproteobacteria bacterium]